MGVGRLTQRWPEPEATMAGDQRAPDARVADSNPPGPAGFLAPAPAATRLPWRSAPTAAAVNCHFTAEFITM
jgi:hypothetical protein